MACIFCGVCEWFVSRWLQAMGRHIVVCVWGFLVVGKMGSRRDPGVPRDAVWCHTQSDLLHV